MWVVCSFCKDLLVSCSLPFPVTHSAESASSLVSEPETGTRKRERALGRQRCGLPGFFLSPVNGIHSSSLFLKGEGGDRRYRLFNERLKVSGDTAVILKSRGNTTQTRNLGIGKQRRYRQCLRVEPSPGHAADTQTLAMRVRRYRVWSSHGLLTGV